ncbi:hypothetical protein ABNX05_10620 [Lysinibacillus sp. M3]|uniref:Uncharacterized protein n=1 Tax=Lysinibacillus zambalensis TaxID=3160866 RepID=A0ABV1MSH9_9BACI
MSFARKRECNVAAAAGFVCAKAKRQQQQVLVLFVRKQSDSNNVLTH